MSEIQAKEIKTTTQTDEEQDIPLECFSQKLSDIVEIQETQTGGIQTQPPEGRFKEVFEKLTTIEAEMFQLKSTLTAKTRDKK